jgi:ankyrin repeat protein
MELQSILSTRSLSPTLPALLTALVQFGSSALHKACLGGHVEVASLLLTHGAHLNLKDSVSQSRHLSLIVW